MEIKQIIFLTATGSKGDLYTLKLYLFSENSNKPQKRLICSCPAGQQGNHLCRHKRTLLTRSIRKRECNLYGENFFADMFDNNFNTASDLEIAGECLDHLGSVYIQLVDLYRNCTDNYHSCISVIDKRLELYDELHLECESELHDQAYIDFIDNMTDVYEHQYTEQCDQINELIHDLVIHV